MDKYICKAKCKSDIPWRKLKNGDWVYGYYVKSKDKYCDDVIHAIISTDCRYRGGAEYDYWDWHEVDPDTVCRYTGKEDKHGNPIFENDIVISVSNIPMTVHWDDACALFEVVYEMDGIGFCANILCDSNRLEIIANKFDNTNLMEVQNES